MRAGNRENDMVERTAAAETIDTLYNKFLLKDVFGGVTPGLILIYVAATALTSTASVRADLAELAFGGWIVLFGAGWITTLAVQSLGDWLYPEEKKLSRYVPSSEEAEVVTLDAWYALRARFRAQPDYDTHRSVYDRIVVIKQASGNGYMALALATIVWLADGLLDGSVLGLVKGLFNNAHLLVLDLLIIGFLARLHLDYAERQVRYLMSVVDRGGQS